MATSSSVLAWKIHVDKEPGGLQSMVSQRVRCELVTHTFTSSTPPLNRHVTLDQ